jgi:proline dehydrogenase
MKLKGTQINDVVLMNLGLKEFKKKAKKKFMNGIKEHNPDGDKGMSLMPMMEKVSSAKEEVMDLWFYLCSIEDSIKETRQVLVKEGLVKPKDCIEEALAVQGHFDRALRKDKRESLMENFSKTQCDGKA